MATHGETISVEASVSVSRICRRDSPDVDELRRAVSADAPVTIVAADDHRRGLCARGSCHHLAELSDAERGRESRHFRRRGPGRALSGAIPPPGVRWRGNASKRPRECDDLSEREHGDAHLERQRK